MEKKYHHGDLKPALIRAGLEILEQDGLEALSLRAIAGRAGVSHTAPKNHFANLRGLLTAIATEGFRRHRDEMQIGVDAHPPGPDRLRAVAEGYVRFARTNPALFRLMFSPSLCDHGDPALSEVANGSYAILREISVDLDWSAPGLEACPPEVRAQRTEWMLWSFVHGYATLMNEGQLHLGPDGQPIHDVLQVLPEFIYRKGR